MSKRTIKQLMSDQRSRASQPWSLALLTKYVEAALKLEYSTIPPYLYAFWSLKKVTYTDPGYAYEALRDHIMQEEMLHMGLVCNLLVGIGGTPDLTSPDAHPSYPDSLAADILQDGNPTGESEVSLRGYSPEALAMFLEIEYPEHGPIEIANDPKGITARLAEDNNVIETAQTIGEFYTAIQLGFAELWDQINELDTAKQVEHYFDETDVTGIFKISTLEDVTRAINIIKRQGEGSSASGPTDTSNSDLAHYYRFLELDRGQKIEEDPIGSGSFKYGASIDNLLGNGDPYPMAVVPRGGYTQEHMPVDDTSNVWDNTVQFNQDYTKMLKQLEAAWNGSPDYLVDAIQTMFGLTQIANLLRFVEIPDDRLEVVGANPGETYGPSFVVVDIETPEESDPGEEIPTWDDIKPLFEDYVSSMNPFEIYLDDYDSVRDYADRILYQIDTGEMPPRWSGAAKLKPEEIKKFRRWIETGMPKK